MTFKIFFHPDFNCWYRSFNGSTFGCCLRVADFTASGDFHPAPEILTLTKIRKIFYGCTASSVLPFRVQITSFVCPTAQITLPDTKKPRHVPIKGVTGLAFYALLPTGNISFTQLLNLQQRWLQEPSVLLRCLYLQGEPCGPKG